MMKKNLLFILIPFKLLCIENFDQIDQNITRQPGSFVTDVFYVGTIKQADLNQASTTAMYKITRPGTYYVANDLTFTPQNNGVIGIEIAANNVTIDLNTKTLNHSTNSQATFNLIKIDGGYSNITITNGTIISDGGGASNVATAILIDRASSVTNNIDINNLLISKFNGGDNTSCGGGIIEFGASTSVANGLKISNVNINTITGNSTDDAYACSIKYRGYINIENSKFNYIINTNASRNSYGIKLSTCTDINVKNCDSSYNTAANNCFSFWVTSNCKDVNFANCNSSVCTSNNNNVAGYYIDSSSYQIDIKECSCSYNTGPYNFGYYLNGSTGIKVTSCEARTLTSTTWVWGFFNVSDGANFNGCIGSNISLTTVASTSGAFYNSAQNCIYKNCLAQYNNATAASQNMMGWYSVNLYATNKNNYFENCIATGNYGTAGVFGFFFNNETNTTISNCKSFANTSAGIAAGIYFDVGCSNCVTINNQFYDNIGTTYQYGYYDKNGFVTGTTNLLTQNIAYGQGISQSGLTGAAYNINKCNYLAGTGSISASDKSLFITDLNKQNMTPLDSANANFINISIF